MEKLLGGWPGAAMVRDLMLFRSARVRGSLHLKQCSSVPLWLTLADGAVGCCLGGVEVLEAVGVVQSSWGVHAANDDQTKLRDALKNVACTCISRC